MELKRFILVSDKAYVASVYAERYEFTDGINDTGQAIGNFFIGNNVIASVDTLRVKVSDSGGRMSIAGLLPPVDIEAVRAAERERVLNAIGPLVRRDTYADCESIVRSLGPTDSLEAAKAEARMDEHLRCCEVCDLVPIENDPMVCPRRKELESSIATLRKAAGKDAK